MNWFKKKKKGQYNVLVDEYVPCPLPTVEPSLENYVTSDYPLNRREYVEDIYENFKKRLQQVIAACDRHSAGSEVDHIIDAQLKHEKAVMEAVAGNNQNQITRIRSAREMEKENLDRKINPLQERAEKLKNWIAEKEGLCPQRQLRLGKRTIGIGGLVTVLALVVDTVVGYSFLQAIMLGNAVLLWVTTLCMSLASDGTMAALGSFMSRGADQFPSKAVYRGLCASMIGGFVLSVVASVMIRWGSMDVTYGTINAAGEFVGKDVYTLAEYGVTLLTGFISAVTGLMCFGFTLDKNAFAISVREEQKRELSEITAELEPLLKERALLERAPDPADWDNAKREAAEHQWEALRRGLKVSARTMMTIQENDPDFTERMAESGQKLLAEMPDDHVFVMSTPISLNQAS